MMFSVYMSVHCQFSAAYLQFHNFVYRDARNAPKIGFVFLKMNVVLVCSCVVSLAVARELGIVFVDFVCIYLWDCN